MNNIPAITETQSYILYVLKMRHQTPVNSKQTLKQILKTAQNGNIDHRPPDHNTKTIFDFDGDFETAYKLTKKNGLLEETQTGISLTDKGYKTLSIPVNQIEPDELITLGHAKEMKN